ncbi:MAG: glycosyltransferase [Armatimonadetes bacterium]|nr:glycosyltransferase [Armatimonadota bacterium]
MEANTGKRVAMYIPSLRPGGAERVTLNLAEGFVEAGFTVDLLVAKEEGNLLGSFDSRINVVRFEASSTFASIGALANYLKTKPDGLISALTHANVITSLAVKWARYRGPVIYAVHSTFSIEVGENASRKHRLVSKLVRSVYRKASRLVTVSSGVAEDLAATLGIERSRIRVIFNPVITASMLEKANEEPKHAWLVHKDRPVVISVGTLRPEKDFETLIRAFKIARQAKPSRLIIFGEGDERAKLESVVFELGLRDDVHLAGFTANPYAEMSHSDLYVLSSRREGLPGALIEGIACGLPAVATDCPSGPNEVLEGGRYGKLVPVGDVSALATAIISSLDHPIDIPKESWRRFERDHVVQEYAELLFGEIGR